MAFVDILLEKNNKNYYDMSFENGDLKKTDGFITALNMSMLCERRANVSEVADPAKRRGWWGNAFLGFPGFELGSKLWLLSQARSDQVTLNLSINYTDDALQWFVIDNNAERIQVNSEYSTFGINGKALDIFPTIYISQDVVLQKGYRLWQNTITEINS